MMKPHASAPNNVALAALVADLTDAPTRADLARHLGISAGQLSRILSGERQAAKRHVEALREFKRSRAAETGGL